MARPLDEHERPFLGQPLGPEEIRGRRRPGRGVLVLSAVLGVLGFLFASFALRRLTAPVERSIMGAKLREIASDPGGFDAVFIGNSHVYREVDPAVFDEEMAAAGHPTRSYNLGGQAMMYPELDRVLRRLIAQRPSRLSWVFIDLSFGWLIDLENFSTGRVVWWHDLPGTLEAMELVLTSRRTRREKLQRLVGHARGFLARLTNKGRGVAWLRWIATGEGAASDALRDHRRGFQALAMGLEEPVDRRRKHFLAAIPQYYKTVWQLAKTRVELYAQTGERGACLRRLIDTCRRNGLQPIFYMPPALTYRVPFLAAVPGDVLPPVLAFNLPKRFPRLYHVPDRFDASHLGADGARLFSKLLAAQFSRYLENPGLFEGNSTDSGSGEDEDH